MNYEKLFDNGLRYFLFSVYILIAPLVFLWIAPSLVLVNFVVILPNFAVDFIQSKVGHYFIASIFLGMALLPWAWSKLEIDDFGKPEYGNFQRKKFVTTVMLSPIIIGIIISCLGLSYVEIFEIYVIWSQKIIGFVNSVFESKILQIILPLIPMVLVSFVALKYLLYLFIIFFIKILYVFFLLIIQHYNLVA